MKHILRAILVLAGSALASLLPITFAPAFTTTLYTIIGIFFSIGYSIVIGFDLAEVTNGKLVKRIRERLKYIERSFVVYFGIATGSFFLADQHPCPVKIGHYQYSFMMLSVVSSFYILAYLIVNYSLMQKLKDEIADKLREKRITKDDEALESS